MVAGGVILGAGMHLAVVIVEATEGEAVGMLHISGPREWPVAAWPSDTFTFSWHPSSPLRCLQAADIHR